MVVMGFSELHPICGRGQSMGTLLLIRLPPDLQVLCFSLNSDSVPELEWAGFLHSLKLRNTI